MSPRYFSKSPGNAIRWRGSANRLRAVVALAFGLMQGLTEAGPNGRNGLKVGYFLDVFVQETQAGESRTQFEPWVSAVISNSIESDTDAILYDSYNDFIERMQKRTFSWDVCPMYAYDFLRLRQQCNLEAILVPEWDAGPEVEYALYVGQNSRSTKIEDLQGKRILFEIGGRGELPYIWFSNQMRKAVPNLTRETINANLRSVSTPLRAALPVFFSEDDIEGCILTQAGFKSLMKGNPQIGKFLRPIVTAPKLLTHVIACRRDLPTAQRQNIINSSMRMAETSASARNGGLHFQTFKPEFLEQLERQWLEYQTSELNAGGEQPQPKVPPAPPETLLDARAAAAASSSEGRAKSALTAPRPAGRGNPVAPKR